MTLPLDQKELTIHDCRKNIGEGLAQFRAAPPAKIQTPRTVAAAKHFGLILQSIWEAVAERVELTRARFLDGSFTACSSMAYQSLDGDDFADHLDRGITAGLDENIKDGYVRPELQPGSTFEGVFTLEMIAETKRQAETAVFTAKAVADVQAKAKVAADAIAVKIAAAKEELELAKMELCWRKNAAYKIKLAEAAAAKIADDIAEIKDPTARATAEWAAMGAAERGHWISEKVFVAYRASELGGLARVRR